MTHNTMEPQSATTTKSETNGSYPSTKVPLEPGLTESQARGQSIRFPNPPKFTDKHEEREYLKGRLAAAFRIFGKYGFDEGVAGHITLRDPVDPTTFWVNPFGVAFSLMKKSDLILVDHAGKIIDGGKVRLLNTAAFMIHGAVHQARPDVVCAAHSHSIYGRSFCTLGRKLDIITQDSCAFYDVRLTSSSYSDRSTDSLDRTTSSTQRSTASSSPTKKAKKLHTPSETKRPPFYRTMAS